MHLQNGGLSPYYQQGIWKIELNLIIWFTLNKEEESIKILKKLMMTIFTIN